MQLLENGGLEMENIGGFIYEEIDQKKVLKVCNNKKIEYLVLDEDVKIIDKNAFSMCKTLKHIVLPKELESIGEAAFLGCKNLNSITVSGSKDGISFSIPNRITELPSKVFAGTGLTTVFITENVSTIAKDAFWDCNKLKEIKVDENNNVYSSVDGVLFSKDKTILIKFPVNKASKKYVVPNTVKEFREGFYQCKAIKEIILSEGVEQIGNGVFECSALAITLPNSVKKIGEYAFVELQKFHAKGMQIIYGESNSFIEQYVKTYLRTRSGDVQRICFISTTDSQETIAIKKKFNYIINDDKVCITKIIQNEEIIEVPNMIEGKLVTCIGESACFNKFNLKEVILPDNIAEIGEYAFACCENMQIVNIPSNIKRICKNAFSCSGAMGNYKIPKEIKVSSK